MRHFFNAFLQLLCVCVLTQLLGHFDNQTLSNLIERLSSIKFGNRAQSNLVAGRTRGSQNLAAKDKGGKEE